MVVGRRFINEGDRRQIIAMYKFRGEGYIYNRLYNSLKSVLEFHSVLIELFQEVPPVNQTERLYNVLKRKDKELIYQIAKEYVLRAEYGVGSVISYTISHYDYSNSVNNHINSQIIYI